MTGRLCYAAYSHILQRTFQISILHFAAGSHVTQNKNSFVPWVMTQENNSIASTTGRFHGDTFAVKCTRLWFPQYLSWASDPHLQRNNWARMYHNQHCGRIDLVSGIIFAERAQDYQIQKNNNMYCRDTTLTSQPSAVTNVTCRFRASDRAVTCDWSLATSWNKEFLLDFCCKNIFLK
jgi:hypothetical protein